jgi:hypothetical protein
MFALVTDRRDGLRGCSLCAADLGCSRRTADGWKFTGRVYEIRYNDTTPLAGSAPNAAAAAADPPAGTTPAEG